LLSALGLTETCNRKVIILDPRKLKPRLTYHIAFHIAVDYTKEYFNRNIFHTIVDVGTSTCVMLLACWKANGHPDFSLSHMFLMMFDGQSFRRNGIIPSFPVQLGGRTVCIEVEVVDAPLDYNLFLGRSWNYAMQEMVAIVFWFLLFPHKG
jgi:hypothetical protein